MTAYPWSQRPDDEPLTVQEVSEALVEARGNITRASLRLKVGSLILRRFVERSPRARAVIQEMKDRTVDRAADALLDALDDIDARRKDFAIRMILHSANGRSWGWAGIDSAAEAVNRALAAHVAASAPQEVRWLDGTNLLPSSPLSSSFSAEPFDGQVLASDVKR